MAFDNITTAELAVGKPITNELMEKFKNRDDFLNAQVGTLGVLTISNPSFEVDSDGDGHPDNWTENFFTGGTGALDTTLSIRGAQSYKFTHPGGAGNGGGNIVSDFFPVSTMSGYLLEYSRRVDGGAVPKVEIINYNRNQSTVSEVLMAGSSIAGATGEWVAFTHGYMPSSNITTKTSITYMKLRLTGGTTDHSTAGTVNFDDIKIKEYPLSSAGNFAIAESDRLIPFTTVTNKGFLVRVAHPGNYLFTVRTSLVGANPSPGSLVWGINGTGVSTVTLATGVSTHTYETSNARRLNHGDVVSALFVAATSTGFLKNMRVSVKDPAYGRAAIHVSDTSTAAT